MDDFWRQRIRVTWIGLGHLTFGAGIMALAISNAEQSVWSLPQFAFGGAIVTQGFIHLTTAWNIQPPADPPALANGPARVGIPLAPAEHGVPALAAEGLILHRNSPPIIDPVMGIGDGIDEVGEAGPQNVGEADPANFVGAGQANFLGEAYQANVEGGAGPANVGQEAVPVIIVDEADREINAGEDNCMDEGNLANDVGEAEPANVVNEAGPSNYVGEAEQANAVHGAGLDNVTGEVNQADPLDDLVKWADENDSTDEFDSEIDIEVPRNFIGLDVPSIKFIDSSESECESVH